MRYLIAALCLLPLAASADRTIYGPNGQVCFVNNVGFMYGCHGGASPPPRHDREEAREKPPKDGMWHRNDQLWEDREGMWDRSEMWER